jgi:hypothetical protein
MMDGDDKTTAQPADSDQPAPAAEPTKDEPAKDEPADAGKPAEDC